MTTFTEHVLLHCACFWAFSPPGFLFPLPSLDTWLVLLLPLFSSASGPACTPHHAPAHTAPHTFTPLTHTTFFHSCPHIPPPPPPPHSSAFPLTLLQTASLVAGLTLFLDGGNATFCSTPTSPASLDLLLQPDFPPSLCLMAFCMSQNCFPQGDPHYSTIYLRSLLRFPTPALRLHHTATP